MIAVESWGREKHQVIRVSGGSRVENRYDVPLDLAEFVAYLGEDGEQAGVLSCAARFTCGCYVLDGGVVRCGVHSALVNVTLEIICW